MGEENITEKPEPGQPGESPSAPSHLPDPGEWPGDERQGGREMTEYTEPPGERDEPGARERERSER